MHKKRIRFAVSAMAILMSLSTPMSLWASAEQSVESLMLEEELLPGTGTEEYDESEMTEEFLTGLSEEETVQTVAESDSTVEEGLNRALDFIQKTVTNPVVNTMEGEWSVMAMARSGRIPETTKAAYLTNLYKVLDEKKGVLHTAKYTEYSRVVMALSSLGVDPTSVSGYDLLLPLANFKKVSAQGINGTTFALIALDTRQYTIPELQKDGIQTTREGLISELLRLELSGGGWTLLGNRADVDITAMVIQSLAPYMNEREDVKAAVLRGIDKLAEMQDETGGYSSEYISDNQEPVKNLESTAQAVIALSAVDVNLLTQEKFMKNGRSLLDEILSFQRADGSFEHVHGDGSDAIATDQGTLALLAWNRACKGQTSLYDMTDVQGESADEMESPEKVEAFLNKMKELPKQLNLTHKDSIFSLKAELGLMKNFEEKGQCEEVLQGCVEEITKQEEDVKQVTDRIWNEINPLKVTLKDKPVVDEIYTLYQGLPEENKKFVERVEDLEQAKTILDKLEKGILAKEIFENIKVSKKEFLYEGKGYTLCIKGKKITTAKDMSAKVELQNSKDSLNIKFEETGRFPTKIELEAPCELKDGIYMLYDDKNKKVEWVSLSEKTVKIAFTEGGSYVLKKASIDDEEEELLPGIGGKEDKEDQKKPSKGNGTITGNKVQGTTSRPPKRKPSTSKTKKATSNTIDAKIKDQTVAKTEFEAVKGKDKNLRIKGETLKKNPYVLTIYGKDIQNTKDMKIGVHEGCQHIEEILKLSEEPYTFTFEEKSNFPGTIQVELTTELNDGKYLLMRYNPTERKADYIQKVKVEGKKTKFIIDQGGEYFIASKAKTKSLDELEDQTVQEKLEKPEAQEEPEVQEEEVLTGTKEKTPIWPIVTVVGGVFVLGGISTGLWYLRKRK